MGERKNRSAWDLVAIARHPKRPQSIDYIENIFDEVQYIHGDRCLGDDSALVGGWGLFQNEPIVFIGQNKGKTFKEKLANHSGMMHPSGYRKARRIGLMAEKFQVPLICFIDTPGAYPGIEAELQGQSLAIAENIQIFSQLKTPIVCIVIGEGCSGGALGIGVGDKFLMMENTYFSVISPEGCASILFKTTDNAAQAAEQMQLSAHSLLDRKLIDGIIPEPLDGAHTDYALTFAFMRKALQRELEYLQSCSLDELIHFRQNQILEPHHDMSCPIHS